jgi:hypothetical protein
MNAHNFNPSFPTFERRKPPKSLSSPNVIVTENSNRISCVSDAVLAPKFDLIKIPAIRVLRTALNIHKNKHLLKSNTQDYGC